MREMLMVPRIDNDRYTISIMDYCNWVIGWLVSLGIWYLIGKKKMVQQDWEEIAAIWFDDVSTIDLDDDSFLLHKLNFHLVFSITSNTGFHLVFSITMASNTRSTNNTLGNGDMKEYKLVTVDEKDNEKQIKNRSCKTPVKSNIQIKWLRDFDPSIPK